MSSEEKKKKRKRGLKEIAEALMSKIGKEKLDDEATKLYFQGERNFGQMEILVKKYEIVLD